MGYIDTIIAAVAAGAAAAGKDVASAAVKDAYGFLKELIVNRIKRSDSRRAGEVENALASKQLPPGWEHTLRQALEGAGATSDEQILAHAQRLWELVGPEIREKFHVQMTGKVQGQIIGDHGRQENRFGD